MNIEDIRNIFYSFSVNTCLFEATSCNSSNPIVCAGKLDFIEVYDKHVIFSLEKSFILLNSYNNITYGAGNIHFSIYDAIFSICKIFFQMINLKILQIL